MVKTICYGREDTWEDRELFDYEREKIEERLPKYQERVGGEIQDVCATCFATLTK